MITVICSKCGGKGKLTSLYCDEPHWKDILCSDCNGTGEVQELSFEERKKLKREAILLP